MRRRFGIKGRVVVDLAKKREYPILGYSPYLYHPWFKGKGLHFAVITRKQTFLRDGLWVW